MKTNKKKKVVKRQRKTKKHQRRHCGGANIYKIHKINHKPSLSHFYHFGCWNLMGENLQKTMDTIQAVQQRNPPDFVVVAGDNYYNKPKKGSKGSSGGDGLKLLKRDKVFHEEKLRQGFELLRAATLSIPKYVLWGNHEFDLMKNPATDEKDCSIIQTQMQISAVNPDEFIIDDNDDTQKPIMHLLMNHNQTLMIMLDTTMFIHEAEGEYNTCYNHIYPSNKSFTAKQKMQENRLVLLFRQLSAVNAVRKIRNVLVVGHHPLCCMKKAKNKDCTILDVNREFVLFFYETILLHSIMADKHVQYFCADLHAFQVGDIRFGGGAGDFVVKQYAVGTGGANFDEGIELDNICSDIKQRSDSRNNNNSNHDDTNTTIPPPTNGFSETTVPNGNTPINLQYQVSQQELLTNGFLDVVCDGSGNIKCEFIPAV